MNLAASPTPSATPLQSISLYLFIVIPFTIVCILITAAIYYRRWRGGRLSALRFLKRNEELGAFTQGTYSYPPRNERVTMLPEEGPLISSTSPSLLVPKPPTSSNDAPPNRSLRPPDGNESDVPPSAPANHHISPQHSDEDVDAVAGRLIALRDEAERGLAELQARRGASSNITEAPPPYQPI